MMPPTAEPADAAALPAETPMPTEAPLTITADMLDPIEPDLGPRDFERGLSYGAIVTLVLIGANVAAYVWQVSQIGLDPQSEQAFIDVGALHRESVLAGQWWRLISAAFLHGGIEHLIGNLLMLYALGIGCEHAFGRGKTLAMYAGCAVAGSLASIAWQAGVSVGASGAIFGLAGLLIAFLRRHRSQFYLRDKRIGGVLAAWAIYTVALGAITPGIDNACHVGGLVAGLVLGWFVPMRPVDPLDARERAFFVRPT